MIVYYFTFFLVCCWVFLFKNVYNVKAIIFPIIILSIFSGLRNYTVGTDTANYTSLYRFSEEFEFNSKVEWGFQIYNYLIYAFAKEYFWLFFFSSIIVTYCYLRVIKLYSNQYLISIFIFLSYGYYTFHFNGLRQGMAMAICFIALPYIIEKKLIKFFITVLLASFFHISAFIMIPIYLLVSLKIKVEYKVVGCFIFSLLVSQILINYIALSNSRYDNYTRVAEQAGGYLTLLFYSTLAILIFLLGKEDRVKNLLFNKSEEIFLCGIALVIPVALLGTDPSGPQRVLYYFTSMCIFLIPYVLKKYNSMLINILFVLFSVIYFSMITMRFGDLYPYQINPIFEVF